MKWRLSKLLNRPGTTARGVPESPGTDAESERPEVPDEAGVPASRDAVTDGVEHGLMVHIPLREARPERGEEPLDLMATEDPLIEAVETAGFEYDGHAIGPDELILYMYGNDADALFDVTRPVIESLSLPTGSFAIKQYGPASDPGVRRERVDL